MPAPDKGCNPWLFQTIVYRDFCKKTYKQEIELPQKNFRLGKRTKVVSIAPMSAATTLYQRQQILVPVDAETLKKQLLHQLQLFCIQRKSTPSKSTF